MTKARDEEEENEKGEGGGGGGGGDGGGGGGEEDAKVAGKKAASSKSTTGEVDRAQQEAHAGKRKTKQKLATAQELKQKSKREATGSLHLAISRRQAEETLVGDTQKRRPAACISRSTAANSGIMAAIVRVSWLLRSNACAGNTKM